MAETVNGEVPVSEFNQVVIDVEKAEDFKKLANAAFQESRFFKAVELYNEAIKYNPKNAVLWANRAFAHTKLEEYATAVEDADKAIELDPSYVKAYYRRGSAHMAMGKAKEALKDFRLAVKAAPKNPDARRKVKECEKAVRDQAFMDAISHPDGDFEKVKLVEVDYTAIEVEESYDGAKIEGDQVTLEFVKNMMEDFKNQKRLHRRYAFQILNIIREDLKKTPTVVDISIPDDHHITVCGDIHGQYYDLMNIFELNGLPSEENPYLFNGDFVDRGSFSVECIFTLMAFKCLYPTGMYLARGNHETKSMNKIYGFEGEVKAKFNDVMMDLFSEVFCYLPLVHLINGKVFVTHGGLFSLDGVKMKDIRAIDRFREPPESGLMCELLWSDPQPGNGRLPSKRGCGVAFGADVTKRFLDENNLDLIVRSHEVKDEGVEEDHNGKLITVFSAPNYCDQMNNKGAFIRFEAPGLQPKITKFEAVPHPDVKPMAYASMFSLLQ